MPSSPTSSTSSLKSASRTRQGRPPSPVSLYGAGAFGMAAPKSPRPLVPLEKKSTREAKGKGKAHTRSGSTSTNTSALSESSANNTPSSNSLKSKGSSKGFSLGWKRKKIVQPSGSMSLPASPTSPTSPTSSSPASPTSPTSPSIDTTPTRPLRPNQSEELISSVPCEAENRVRQLDKVTRTFGEQVPVELILQPLRRESAEQHNPPPATVIKPALTVEPTDPVIPSEDMVRKIRPLPPTPIDILAANVISVVKDKSPSNSCRTSSPVLPDQDYQDLKATATRAQSPLGPPPAHEHEHEHEHSNEVEPESPILFSSSPASVLPSMSTLTISTKESDRPDENSPPYELYHPRPKPGPGTWSSLSSPSPSMSMVTNKTSSRAVGNGTIKIPTIRRPSSSTTSPTLLPVQAPSSPRRPRTSVRPQSSHAGATPFWGESQASESSPQTQTQPQLQPRPDSPFQDSTVPIHAWLNTTWTSNKKGCIIRQEGSQGWSGEWNRSDMQDVINTLRLLK